MAQFFYGLRASLHLTTPLKVLSRSKTTRRLLGKVIALNVCLIVVDGVVSRRLPQALACVLFEAASGRPPTALRTRETVDSVFAAVIFTFAVLPLIFASLVFTNYWSVQMAAKVRRSIVTVFSKKPDLESPALAAPAASGGLRFVCEEVGGSFLQAVLLVAITVQAALIDGVPLIGRPLAIALTAITVGFAAVDSDVGRWGARNVRPSVAARLAALEEAWPWYAGFGALTALASYFSTPGVNAGVYGLISIPLAIIAAGLPVSALPPLPDAASASQRISFLLPFKWTVLLIVSAIDACKRRCCARRPP